MAKMKVDRRALAVRHACCKDPYRMALNCVKATPEECVATNGRILIRIENKAHQDDDANGELMLKPSVLQFIAKMFGRTKFQVPVELEQTEEKASKLNINGHDGATELSVSTRPMDEGKYPSYDHLQSPEAKEQFVLDVVLLEKVLKAAKEAQVRGLHFKTQPDPFGPILITGSEEDGFTAVVRPMRH